MPALQVRFGLTGALFILLGVACSPRQLKEIKSTQLATTAEQVSSQAAELQGFEISAALRSGSSDGGSGVFDQGVLENQQAFSLEVSQEFEPQYSEPFVMTDSTFSLFGESADSDVCSGLSYQSQIPQVKEVVNHLMNKGICGSVQISFCIRMMPQTGTSALGRDLPSPPVSVEFPCSDDYFKEVTVSAGGTAPDYSLVFTHRALVDQVYISQTADCSEGEWTVLSSDPVSYSSVSGTIYAKFGDVFGHTSDCREFKIGTAITAPASSTVQINSGSEYVTSSSVTLTLQSSGASEMLVSDSADCSSGSWESYSTSRSWNLSKTNGTVFVYAMFRNAAGQSSCVGDSVIHDDIAPSSNSLTIGSSEYTSALKNTLFLSSTGATEMYVTNTAGCASGGSWETYATSKTQWSLSATNAKTYVYAKFRDSAGNESSCVSDFIWHDDTAPSAPSGLSDGGEAVSATTTAAISWTASTDNLTGIQAYELSVGSSSGDTDVRTWTSAGNVSTYTFTDLSLTAGNVYYVNIRAQDLAGNTSSVVSSSGFHYGFVQGTYIKPLASGSTNNDDQFASVVAVSGDTLVVGSANEDCNQSSISDLSGGASLSCDENLSNSGAVWVYRKSGVTWSPEAFIKASNAGADDKFGTSVAISGNTLVVGAPYEDSNQTTVTNGSSASSDDTNGDSGAVYIFTRSGSTWTQSAYLKAPNNDAGDLFGKSVAIDTDTVIVGATGEDSIDNTVTNGTTASADNTGSGKGAAYVFKRTTGTWAQEAYLKVYQNGGSLSGVGQAVDIDGDLAVVSTQSSNCRDVVVNSPNTACSNYAGVGFGAVWVFQRSGSTWAQEAYLSTPVIDNGDFIGASISLSGDTIVAGSVGEDSAAGTIINGSTASSDGSLSNAGAAYVFVKSGGLWAQQAFLKPSNPHEEALFGTSVAVEGDYIVVGAPAEGSAGTSVINGTTSAADSATDYGAAYVFSRSGTTWSQAAFLKASNHDALDNFAGTVAMDSQSIVVGSSMEDSTEFSTVNTPKSASSDNSGADAGAAYIIRY
ncbi:MAG: hypothetical protein H6618_04850 [Deltaproteobacteria bacterium]|nr:hypothetical protein [Deltaproteobacteria bacterium]